LLLIVALFSQEDENDDPKCRLNKCEVFVSIGELSGLENNLDASIDEFGKALKIRKSLLEPSDRKIAEVSSLLAVTHRKKREHAMALKYFEETKEVLQKRLNRMLFFKFIKCYICTYFHFSQILYSKK
jgi:tetratricopeptide (TPR) repeat protein